MNKYCTRCGEFLIGRTMCPHCSTGDVPYEYSYNTPVVRMSVAGLLAGFGCLFMAGKAMNNDAGLIFNGIFWFDQAEATIFYWVMAAASGFGALVAVLRVVQSLCGPNRLRLDQHGLSLPHGLLSKKTAQIPYSAINGLDEQQTALEASLLVSTANGHYSIMRSSLSGNNAYESVKNILASRTHTAAR